MCGLEWNRRNRTVYGTNFVLKRVNGNNKGWIDSPRTSCSDNFRTVSETISPLLRLLIVTGTILLICTPACECFLVFIQCNQKVIKTILVCKNRMIFWFRLKLQGVHNRFDSYNIILHFLSKIVKIHFRLYFQHVSCNLLNFHGFFHV